VGFQINTNISSLQAQEYLRISSDFQSKTISRVTSGLRIVSSGDDAAGLAIANGFRSDQAVLTQGVRNANDGLSQLQIADGGINNISKLLDRARSLATQSASGTFSGDRSVLNSEFQSVIGEIDRQAQAIGLDQNGEFAKNLNVFIGGGRANNGTTSISNGSVSVDLSRSTVDAKSLGLKGVQSIGIANTDIGAGSATTSVSEIVANGTNTASLAAQGYTDFYISGAGFSGDDKVKLQVNLAGVSDTGTLVTAVNNAIDAAGLAGTQAATAFKNANVQATINTDAAGKKQLAFTSSGSSFQVQAGDRLSNALMGNFTAGSTGKSLTNTVTAGAVTTAGVGTTSQNIIVRVQGGGLASPVDLQINSGSTTANALTTLSSLVANNAALQAAGISASGLTAVGGTISFTSARGESFNVSALGDNQNRLGLGSYLNNAANGTSFEYTSVTAASAYAAAAKTNTFDISIGGGSANSFSIAFAGTETIADATILVNAALTGDAETRAAGLYATNDGTSVTIQSSNGTAFRLNARTAAGSEVLGFGTAGVAAGTSYASSATDATNVSFFNNGGGSAVSTEFVFNNIVNGQDVQNVTIAAPDASGAPQSLAIKLSNNVADGRNARNIDEALATINSKLQQTNNETLKDIVAVKDYDGTNYKIRFQSTLTDFSVSLSATGTGSAAGLGTAGQQGQVYEAAAVAGGSTADISSADLASSAVTALSNAVASLGRAQAVVGRGQNQFNYAVNLAQSQLSNLAAAESRIRDADLASEAANLSKAQILLQAGVAALAQANSAPQQVLSLLRG
jgi:flagellin